MNYFERPTLTDELQQLMQDKLDKLQMAITRGKRWWSLGDSTLTSSMPSERGRRAPADGGA